MRHVSDDQRRARLAIRHALVPGAQAATPEDATRAVTVLHATEPATVYLSCWARVPAVTTAEIDRALYDDRTIVKQLAMRRTLFVFPRDLLPAVWASAAARTATAERARLAKDVVRTGLDDGDGLAWLDLARAEVMAVLDDSPDGLTAAEIRQAVPRIDVKLDGAGGVVGAGSRVLTLLGAGAEIIRGTNTGGWHTSRPRWTGTQHWLGEELEPTGPDDGYRELIRRWLFSFGPGTEADLVWWFGSTKAAVRRALAELDAEAVELDDGDTGWLLPDDVAEVADPGPWAALLPVLDPTVMGWKGRGFYLGPYKDQIFDTNGNAGTTAWVDGRIVGTWVQDDDGAVRLHLIEQVDAAGRRLLDAEATRLTAWLDGFKVGSVYSSPAMRVARAG